MSLKLIKLNNFNGDSKLLHTQLSEVLAYFEYVEESGGEIKDNQSLGEIEANSRVNPGISSCAKYNNNLKKINEFNAINHNNSAITKCTKNLPDR